MKKIITNNTAMLFLSILLILIGTLHSIAVKDFVWFQRIGSLIVCLGILLLVRPNLVQQSILLVIGKLDSPFTSNDPRHYEYVGESVPDIVKQDVKNRKAINIYGPAITFFGTIIWGYGDLLNKVFF